MLLFYLGSWAWGRRRSTRHDRKERSVTTVTRVTVVTECRWNLEVLLAAGLRFLGLGTWVRRQFWRGFSWRNDRKERSVTTVTRVTVVTECRWTF